MTFLNTLLVLLAITMGLVDTGKIRSREYHHIQSIPTSGELLDPSPYQFWKCVQLSALVGIQDLIRVRNGRAACNQLFE